MKVIKVNNIIKVFLIILVILFAIYVWPTPYRNMNDRKYFGKDVPFRIHRITGIGEIWKSGGWKEIE